MGKLYTMSDESLTTEINKGKELFVDSMFDEGIINKKQKELMKRHSIAIVNKGFFGTLWDRIFKEKNNSYFFIVKVLNKIPKNK